MDNKKKPSVLRLVPSHHDFDKQGLIFTEEMLKWPIFANYIDRKDIENGSLLNVHRNVFKGLTQIYPFESKVSIEADPAIKAFIFSTRTWGEIYFENECILRFSHDTRKDNCPFVCLTQWPELECDPETNIEILNSWTADMWEAFFKGRILDKAKKLKNKSKGKIQDAISLDERAQKLLFALIV